jgi:hypothetical protein
LAPPCWHWRPRRLGRRSSQNQSSSFEERVHGYQGCIAAKAREFEITGDTAESVAVAAIGACKDFRRKEVEDYIRTCFVLNGRNVLDQEVEKRFLDWGIRSVITFRSKRLREQKP